MSLARTALRAATILALSDRGDGSGEPATLAGHLIYDTLMEPEHLFGEDKPTPLVIVYTDDDEGPNVNRAGGVPTFDRTCSLTLELICAIQRDGAVGLPQTDGELEAILDLLEYQVRVALLAPGGRWAGLWGKLVRGIVSYQSTRVMDEKGDTRMAARTVVYGARILDECPPAALYTDPGLSGIAALPAPLRLVAEAVVNETGGNAKTVKDVIAFLQTKGIDTFRLLPALKDINIEAYGGETEDGKVGVVQAVVEGLDD